MAFRDGTPTLDELEKERLKQEANQRALEQSTNRLVFKAWFPKTN